MEDLGGGNRGTVENRSALLAEFANPGLRTRFALEVGGSGRIPGRLG